MKINIKNIFFKSLLKEFIKRIYLKNYILINLLDTR